jgi:hypothetical protein
MAQSFASVAEARRLTGKSESTIKRLVREIVADPDHTDRGSIQPSHTEVSRLRSAGEPYVWKIDRELLLKRFPLKEREEAAPAGGGPPAGELVAQVLQEQLSSKDEQIANLGERQRETNVLMRELQARLALAAPRAPASTVEEADAAEPPLAHRGQPTAPATTPPVRRNRLLRLLGL